MKKLGPQKSPTEAAFEYFLKDTKNHGMEILLDSDIYRHLKFTNNGSSIYRFDLVTWPGHLSISGDMGSFTFERLPDMFQFFRTDRSRKPGASFEPEKDTNLSYWAEKLVAVDKNGFKALSSEAIKMHVLDYISDEEDLKEQYGEEAWKAIRSDIDDLISEIDDAEDLPRTLGRIYEFSSGEFEFVDFFERDIHEYTSSFAWACAAIAYGVLQYDLANKAQFIESLARGTLPQGVQSAGVISKETLLAHAKNDLRVMTMLPTGDAGYAICGLSEDQVRAISDGVISDVSHVDPKACPSLDDAAGYFLLGIYATEGNEKAISVALSKQLRELGEFNSNAPVFAKPITQEGASWMRKNGFVSSVEESRIQMSRVSRMVMPEAESMVQPSSSRMKL